MIEGNLAAVTQHCIATDTRKTIMLKRALYPLVVLLMVLGMDRMAGAESYGPQDEAEYLGVFLAVFDACEPLEPALTRRARVFLFEDMSRLRGPKHMDVLRAMPDFQFAAQEVAKEIKAMTPDKLRQFCQENILNFAQKPMMPVGFYLTNSEFWESATLDDTKDAIAQFKTLPQAFDGTPLIIASGVNQSPEVIAALIDACGGVNFADSELDGMTALMSAAYSNTNSEITVLLLRRGAQIKARAVNGRTALMWAAKGNAIPQVLDALIAAGADVTALDQVGKTALDYLLDNRSPAVQAKIEELRQVLSVQK